jgi:outer membrane protein assembly factor BamD (BamD/ComL family)
MEAKYEKLMVPIIVLVIGLVDSKAVAELVAYYHFNEGNDTTVVDASGSGHYGLVIGTGLWVDSRSGYGKAIYFNGQNRNGYVYCGTWNPSEETDQLTITLWIRWEGGNDDWQGVVSKRNDWGADKMMWQIRMDVKSQLIEFEREGSTPNCGDRILPKGKWTHVAATFDKTTVVFYINGEVTGRDNFSFGSKTDSPIIIGAADPSGLQTFNGAVDEVCVFNNALSEDEITLLYNTSGTSFAPSELVALLDEVRQAKKFSEERNPQENVAFFEKKIAEYKFWEKRNPKHVGLRSELLASDLYFLLAKSRKAGNASIKDIAETYMKSALASSRSHNYVPALLWLFNNLPVDDYIKFVRQCASKSHGTFDNIHLVTKDFESSENWDAFKLFLDAVFPEVDDINSFAGSISADLKKDGLWLQNFLDYCRSKPVFAEYTDKLCEEMAGENIQKEEYLKAAEIYRDISNQCSREQDKNLYKLKAYECIFEAGECDMVLNELDIFIGKNKASNNVDLAKAMLLKGHVYVQLGEADRASNIFSKIIKEYPESRELPEASFFVGYCNLLGGKFEEAREAFNLVIESYPQSSYSSKARLCIKVIKDAGI